MSKDSKKKTRQAFRDAVFKRDNNCCRICRDKKGPFDAHHITQRNDCPNGGYVKENGITLCAICHEKAEEYYKTGLAVEGYTPNDLYKLIGSSLKEALEASEKLKC
jgi:5-methylcytosine-specific restriction endonuclease McrA